MPGRRDCRLLHPRSYDRIQGLVGEYGSLPESISFPEVDCITDAQWSDMLTRALNREMRAELLTAESDLGRFIDGE